MVVAQGVLRAGLPLTRLELSNCSLADGAQELGPVLMRLPGLKHLSIWHLTDKASQQAFPANSAQCLPAGA